MARPRRASGEPRRPVSEPPGGGPTRDWPTRHHRSELRELTGLDQVDQHVPRVLLEDGEVASFPDPHLVAEYLDLGARGARWAQGHRGLLHCAHLLSFTSFRCSM